MNFVAASFVQCAQDVLDIRATLGTAGRHIQIISKIENTAGLENFDEILEVTDGVMVARGDLGNFIFKSTWFVKLLKPAASQKSVWSEGYKIPRKSRPKRPAPTNQK